MAKPATIVYTQNDLKPDRYFQLYNRNNDVQLDISLSTTTVTAKLRAKGASTSLWEVTCSKVIPDLGIVLMAVPTDGLDQDAGRYEVEITVDFNGSTETVIDIYPVQIREEFGAVA